jgi:hypothetical protein
MIADLSKRNELDDTKHLMGALVRMKPKPHEEMKIGKKKTRAPRKTRRACATLNNRNNPH